MGKLRSITARYADNITSHYGIDQGEEVRLDIVGIDIFRARKLHGSLCKCKICYYPNLDQCYARRCNRPSAFAIMVAPTRHYGDPTYRVADGWAEFACADHPLRLARYLIKIVFKLANPLLCHVPFDFAALIAADQYRGADEKIAVCNPCTATERSPKTPQSGQINATKIN